MDNLKGHSNCELRVFERDGERYVRKTSRQARVNLCASADLQNAIHDWLLGSPYHNSEAIRVQQVHLNGTEADGTTWMEYRYIPELEFLQAVECLPVETLRYTLGQVVNFVGMNMIRSDTVATPVEHISDKISSVMAQLPPTFSGDTYPRRRYTIASEVCYRALQQASQCNERVPIGLTHGDLTLTNLLFDIDHITLIDISRVFLSSPWLDIIKLRQDSHYHWALHRAGSSSNPAKLLLYWLDHWISIVFYREINTYTFKALEILNYLRILPYATELATVEYLTTILEELCYSYYRSLGTAHVSLA